MKSIGIKFEFKFIGLIFLKKVFYYLRNILVTIFMRDVKEELKRLFIKNVFGKTPNIDGYNLNHNGAKGHWLEKQFGKKPDADNNADFWGYECKNHTTSGKTTYGDWTANEYIFDKDNLHGLDREQFLKIWGKPNKNKKGRLSWSGEHVPKFSNGKYTSYGQQMLVDSDCNILIKYNFLKDQRIDKDEIGRASCRERV